MITVARESTGLCPMWCPCYLEKMESPLWGQFKQRMGPSFIGSETLPQRKLFALGVVFISTSK